MHFDVVVGNPPYKGSLHLDFLKLAYRLSNRWVIWVHPSIWLYDRKRKKGLFTEIRNMLEETAKEFIIINGNILFGIRAMVRLSIDVIDKEKNSKEIRIEDRINNNIRSIDSIHKANIWNSDIYENLETSILSLCQKDNALNHRNKKEGGFYVNIPKISGNNRELYTFAPRNIKVSKNSSPLFLSFEEEKQAQNFINFMKTQWGMFCLSIYKNNQNLDRGELGSIPWLDWSKNWEGKEFEKLISASPEEIKFIKENIPDYYSPDYNKDDFFAKFGW